MISESYHIKTNYIVHWKYNLNDKVTNLWAKSKAHLDRFIFCLAAVIIITYVYTYYIMYYYNLSASYYNNINVQ